MTSRVSRLDPPTLRDIVADVASIGRSLGLRVEEPIVLKDSLNLLIWLRPSAVVARVQVRTGLVRDREVLADSLAFAAWLAAAGLPVSPPTNDVDPGPHVGATGRPMTLWRHLGIRDEDPDPAEAGRTLATIHAAAGGYDGPLRHVGPLEEIDRLAAVVADRRPDEAGCVRSLRARLRLPDLPVQAIHGDAHLGNVVLTDGGLAWLDWEESWRGPVAWDLAALDHRRRVLGELGPEIERALAGYGPFDRDAVDAWAPAVALWAAAWGIVGEAEGLAWGDNSRRRLAWLEENRPAGRQFGLTSGSASGSNSAMIARKSASRSSS